MKSKCLNVLYCPALQPNISVSETLLSLKAGSLKSVYAGSFQCVLSMSILSSPFLVFVSVSAKSIYENVYLKMCLRHLI